MLYNLEAGSAVLTDNNDIRIYTDGKEKFRALIHEMKQAKKYIHMQYYIIRSDELWQEIEPARNSSRLINSRTSSCGSTKP